MTLDQRISQLAQFGNTLRLAAVDDNCPNAPDLGNAYNQNKWFTPSFVRFALQVWADSLSVDNLRNLSQAYNFGRNLSTKTLGIVQAGNIPLVGLHDLICGFLCGVKMVVKMSSKDKVLMQWAVNQIVGDNNDVVHILSEDEFFGRCDAMIATGSNNTFRYFDYYFSQYPHILRRHRNAVAVLSGNETTDELQRLADDVFMYFGLGCRSVAKVYVPQNYDLNTLKQPFHKYADLKNHNKYANNFDYQRAVMSMNSVPFVDLGNLLLVSDTGISSPISVLHYQRYTDLNAVIADIRTNEDKIQCVVSNINEIHDSVAFGHSQRPCIDEFADNVDTIQFILNL